MVTDTIGPYQIIRLLGKGGMATVYQARDPHFDRDVAIKLMPREFMHDDTFRARFAQEAQVLARFEHSAIVPIYDHGTHEGQPYLVMRFMAGGSLAAYIKKGPMAFDEVVRIITRIGPALDRAHQRGIIHRDVKPANILFDEHGDPYLSDFGIVKLTESTAQLTGSGVVGTANYMAPEIAEEGGLSWLIDIYALGITLYEMLTAELPYKADTPIGVIAAHSLKPIPDVLKVRPDLPDMVRLVMNRAIAKDPADRYERVSDLIDDLHAIEAGDHPPSVTVASPVVSPVDNTTRRMPLTPIPDSAPMPSTEPRPSTPPAGSPSIPTQRTNRIPWLLFGLGGGAFVCVVIVAVVLILMTGLNQTVSDTTGMVAVDTTPLEAVEDVSVLPSTIPEVTASATFTPIPTSQPDPAISNVRFCNRPCDREDAEEVSIYPASTFEVFVEWEYNGMNPGMSYTREWFNQGERWIRYECTWEGPSSGTWQLTLFDHNGGLRAGNWLLIITVEGKIVLQTSIEVQGDNTHWDPFTTVPPCPDWD